MKYLLAMLFKYSQKYYLEWRGNQLSKRIDQYVEHITPEPRTRYVYDDGSKQYISVTYSAYRDFLDGKMTAIEYSQLFNSKELQDKYYDEYNIKKKYGTSDIEEASKSIEG